MPPKKNGKKNGNTSTKKESVEVGNKSVFDALSEGGKEFFLAQIRDLEERLKKYQQKCDELEVREKDLSSKYNNVEREKRDIVLYLKRSLAQKEDKLNDILEKLLALQVAKDAEKKSYEMQMSMLRHELQQNKDKLTSENMALAAKLASLEEFRVHKDELMAQLASLKDQLEKQKLEYQTVIYNLERKAVLDNDRLKKEMQQHVAAVAAEFRKASDKKMPEMSRKVEVGQLSDKIKELVGQNDALKATEKQLKRETEIMEPLLNEMTRKSLANQKVVEQLTEKCKQMHAELKNCESHKQKHQQLQEDHTALQESHETLRKKHQTIMDRLSQKQAEAERLRKELQEEKMQRGQIEVVLHEAAIALTDVLKVVPKEKDSEVQALALRNQMMEKLLAVLNSAADIGKGPAISDFFPSTAHTHKISIGRPTSRLSHYKPGDLGLIPRQTTSPAFVLSKTGSLSKCTRHNFQSKAKNGLALPN